MVHLKAENITKKYEGEDVISGISLELHEGEIVSLLGVSGGGKTTLFNVLSGLSQPEDGRVLLSGEDITGKPGKISYMLQKDLLLPYYTTVHNVALPLIIKGMEKKKAEKKAAELFSFFGLEGTEKKFPHQLSGGMRQRAAFLRTYLSSEGVALLDEPFSALDTITKTAVHEWYLKIMEEIKLGKYRHFKGNEYEVIGTAKHSETLEEYVVYKALYGEGGLWIRPASMWNETVERDGKTYKRFECIG